MRSVFYGITLISAVIISAQVAMGQVATGVYKYGTFDTPGIDTINVGNLNLHLALPLLQKGGRGALPFYYDLGYDNSIWTPESVNGSTVWTPAQAFGWHGETEIATGYVGYDTEQYIYTNPDGEAYTETIDYNFTYHDPFGTQHPFNTSTVKMYCWGTLKPSYCNQQYPSFTEVATDGSGFTLSVTNYTTTSLTGATGKQFAVSSDPNGAATITDNNGNQVSADGTGHFTDTTGNVVLTVSGSSPNPQSFAYEDASGNSQNVTVTYKSYTVQTAFGCSNIGEYGPLSLPLVDTVTYPDGSTYSFSYEPTPGVPGNVTGRLASVKQPQGGWIYYTYSGENDGIDCADGSTIGMTRKLDSDSGSANSSISYNRTITGPETSNTEVVDGLGNHKLYTFVEATNQPTGTTAVYYETSRSVYEGAATGTPVLAKDTCYNGAGAPCSTSAFPLPISQIDTYDTFDGIETDGSTTKFNSYGSPIEADVYDFGTTSRGGLLRKEVWGYGYSIPGLPTIYKVYDGAGNPAGETDYGYDETAATPSSNIPQHIAMSGARGNLTSVTSYASAGTSYKDTATYEDTGSLLTTLTPNGKTTMSYDPTFSYRTGVSLPTPSSGVQLATGETFDETNTGLPLSFTDSSQQSITIPTYDSMLRPHEIDYPDGGKVTYSYSAAQVGASNSISGDTEVQSDGYGRLSRVAVYNGQTADSWYQEDMCYDANGNPTFISYPYQGSGLNSTKVCSGSGDIRTYDVLGRLSSIVSADGESRTYTYLGRATKSVDANGVARISQGDGLGRLTKVCEISSNSNMPGSGAPVDCGMDIAGTGFITSFSYDLANAKTTITQGEQTRIFQTDWLGRPTLLEEPESGQTAFSYAYNSTGLQVTRKRPTANQSDPSVLTTTTSQYDSIGRMVSASYSDGTPTKTFTYDSSAGSNFSDLSQTNLKGRLSIASVPTAMTAFSYDPLGRISYLDECLPSGCGTTEFNRQIHYVYDLAGNMTNSTDGSGVTTSYGRSPAGEVQSLTSSLSNTTNPASVVSNVLNGPDGPVNYSLGNGLSAVYHYDSLGRVNGGWVCRNSTSNSCTGGSQVYGYTTKWSQQQLTCSSDTVLNQESGYGYDEFNRLTSRTVNSGTEQNYTWTYDRYGNRTEQGALQGGLSPTLSFNTSTNQVISSGYTYDAAGNVTSDGFHNYTYDAEGNIIAVDGGSTAQYTYNALNQRVRTAVSGSVVEFVYNAAGQRVSEWDGNTRTLLKGKYYWGGVPVAYYASGATHFEHQDWLGTERLRTTYNGAVEGTFSSLPWGDGQTASGSDSDAYHFANLDYDPESYTDHARFRQYSNNQGRWLSPDPYTGSYHMGNPQSFNRYAYAMDNPLSFVDPSGLDYCTGYSTTEGYDPTTGEFGGQAPVPENEADCEAAGGIWVITDDQTTGITTTQSVYVFDEQSQDLMNWGGFGVGVNFDDPSADYSGNTDNSGLGGGGGGGTSFVAPSNGPSYSRSQICGASTVLNNGTALGLDALSLAADFFGPEEQYAKLGIGLTLSTAATINSAAHTDYTGLGLGMASYLKAPVEMAAESASWSWAKYIPLAGIVADVYSAHNDYNEMMSDYSDCMEHY